MASANTQPSENEENMPLAKLRDQERYTNAERIAKALRPYLVETSYEQENHQLSHRGRTKDKRICQLNAAYKYCMHLEKTVRELCEQRDGNLMNVPDDCKLVANITSLSSNNTTTITPNLSLNNSSIKFKISNIDMDDEQFFQSPNQNEIAASNLHNSNLITSAVSRPILCNLENFNNVDASPICNFLNGKQHYDENNNIINNISLNNSNLSSTSSRKRRVTNELTTPLSQSSGAKKAKSINDTIKSSLVVSTPNPAPNSLVNDTSTSSKSSQPDNEANVSESNEFKKHYFLRSSTMRLRNMLSQNANTKATSTTSRKSNKLSNSSMTSSRSSSVTTTPSVRTNENMSSTSSSSSHELDSLDNKQLYNVSNEQMSRIYELDTNQDLQNSKKLR